MTTHEVLTSLFWLVLLGYVVYLGWFVARTITRRRTPTPQRRKPHG